MEYHTSPAISRDEIYRLCIRALHDGDSQTAQVYATLLLTETMREAAVRIASAADMIAIAARG